VQLQKKFELHGHAAGIYALGPGINENELFSGSSDRFLAAWDIHLGAASKFSVKLDAPVYSFSHVAKDRLIIGLSNGHFHVIDLKSKQEIRYIVRHSLGIYSIAVAQNGLVYTAGGDGYLNQWDEDFNLLRSVKLSSKKIRRTALSNNQELLYNCSGDGVMVILNTLDLSMQSTLVHEQGSVNAVLELKGGKLITGGWDGHLYLWEPEGTTPLQRIPAHNYAIYDFAISHCGKYIASASRDKSIKIWNAETLEFIQKIDFKSHQAHRYSINCLYWDTTSGLLFSGSDDRVIMAWMLH
jgi:WD40 repeat protein